MTDEPVPSQSTSEPAPAEPSPLLTPAEPVPADPFLNLQPYSDDVLTKEAGPGEQRPASNDR
jgi:hypothetical protein